MPARRMTRECRKNEILRVLRKNSEGSNAPLTCRQIARKMGMSGFSYINTLLLELADDGEVCVNVHKSNKKISNVRFEYYV